MRKLTVANVDAGRRLDRYLARYLREAPGGFLYKMLRKKNITLNGRRAEGTETLAEGDEITLYLSDETLEKFMGKPAACPDPPEAEGDPAERAVRRASPSRSGVPLPVLYEDEDVLFVNKPAGMLSQKAEAQDRSVCEYVTDYLLEEGALTRDSLRTFRPGVCNRLDRNTSGIISAGKTSRGLRELSALFRSRQVDKRYLCLAAGNIQETFHITGFLEKDPRTNTVQVSYRAPGDPIETVCRPLERGGGCTLLEVRLITGKTHQIRAHLASKGHPVLGDRKYGDEEANRRLNLLVPVRRQLLHARSLHFPEEVQGLPRLAGMTITAPLPRDFARCLRALGIPADS